MNNFEERSIFLTLLNYLLISKTSYYQLGDKKGKFLFQFLTRNGMIKTMIEMTDMMK